MEKVKIRYKMAVSTLGTLKEALDKFEDHIPDEYYVGMRDSAIQRFEYSVDTLWKFLKIYLQEYLKFEANSASPRAVIRDAVNAKVLSEQEFDELMDCISSRNETSHAYNESLAQEIFAELPYFYSVMYNIISRIKMNE